MFNVQIIPRLAVSFYDKTWWWYTKTMSCSQTIIVLCPFTTTTERSGGRKVETKTFHNFKDFRLNLFDRSIDQ